MMDILDLCLTANTLSLLMLISLSRGHRCCKEYLTPNTQGSRVYNRVRAKYNLSAANQNLLKSVQSGYILCVRAPFSRIEFDLNLRRETFLD